MNEDKKTKWTYGPVHFPISIVIKAGERDSITRKEICERFSDIIEEYTGASNYVVDFDKIERSPYLSDDVILNYNYSTQAPEEKSIYYKLMNMVYDFENRPMKPFDIDQWLKNRQEDMVEGVKDSVSLEDAYIGMKYDEMREKKTDDWSIVKHIVKNKIKSLFNNKKDGSFFEVSDLNFRLDKLSKFNPEKHNYVKSYMKKNGKTLSNYVEASIQFDKDRINKFKLDPSKHSSELRIDLAMSGLNDDIV